MVLPPDVQAHLLDIAARSQLMLFAELHGTREVPALVRGLLGQLAKLGYVAVAVEVPHDVRPSLLAYADGRTPQPPDYYARPTRDGRGSAEMLQLAQAARAAGFELLCFDQSFDQPARAWADRDRWMARNLLEQWSTLPSGARVVGVCGSLHARLAPERGIGGLLRRATSGGERTWPSMAGWIRQWQPGLAVSTIEVRFAAGSYYNMGERTIYARPGSPQQPWLEHGGDTTTVELWLPRATVATFLSPPS